MSENNYEIHLSEKAIYIIIQALDLYSRVGMGQLETVKDVLLKSEKSRENILKNRDAIERLLDLVKEMAMELSPSSYQSIMSPEISDDFRTAYDMIQVLRNRLAWDREPKGGFTVDFDPLFQTSPDPPVKIKKK